MAHKVRVSLAPKNITHHASVMKMQLVSLKTSLKTPLTASTMKVSMISGLSSSGFKYLPSLSV